MQEAQNSQQAALPIVIEDRRTADRVRTVYRLARVQSQGSEGLARIRNVSDDGMKIDLGLPVELDQWVRVWISETVSVHGQVVWKDEKGCGLQFAEPVDSITLLRDTAEQIRLGETRPPRISTELRAVVSSQQGISPTSVHDVSQRGMKLVHDGRFTPGLPVKVRLESGIERRGVIRWVRDEVAGLMLTEVLSVEELKMINCR